MCWNADISINTFVFACFALLFILFSNTFTKYKSTMFENPLYYLLFFEIASVQLIEFFLWRNLKNKYLNQKLSSFILLLIVLHQLTLILIVPNKIFKYILLFLFILFIIIYQSLYSGYKNYTTVAKNGHLLWEVFNKNTTLLFIVGLLFYIIPVLLIGNVTLYLIMFPVFILSFYYYYKYRTFGTMWCWVTNFALLYFIIDILLIQPYYEYNALC